ncbi:hypothetical protein M0802_009916 [Mischocyttarus mexicanus]|nr:hypothetical protein M0802_009916 [Mischocyttarus mexicanus]
MSLEEEEQEQEDEEDDRGEGRGGKRREEKGRGVSVVCLAGYVGSTWTTRNTIRGEDAGTRRQPSSSSSQAICVGLLESKALIYGVLLPSLIEVKA